MSFKERSLRIVRQCLVALALAISFGCGNSVASGAPIDDSLRDESIANLRFVLKTQPKWVKVHAAEWLLDLNYSQGVVAEFRKELAAHGDEPEYRIGIWRVLSKASQRAGDERQWHDKIKQAFFDKRSPDRVHAVESMAKLGLPLSPAELRDVAAGAEGSDARLAVYCRWVLAVADGENRTAHRDALIALLKSSAMESRQIAAYALRHLGTLSPNQWEKVVARANEEPDSLTKVRLEGAALIAAPATAAQADLDAIRTKLTSTPSLQSAPLDGEWTRLVAEIGQISDVPKLSTYLHADVSLAPDPASAVAMADLRASAANAILRIDRRVNQEVR